eukprot:TRINITY_DN20059_c0_g1_i1.p1 TRINITY_DN20059_c0_g1~~TRINITY_DN20059_c0_g1_i1.p1  ORF type:complete len:101 (+),score=8.94 TRINITY_DN20059_c0_g1_i1:128-430(+)
MFNLFRGIMAVQLSFNGKGKWGSFGTRATFCPDGSFVYGYRVRSEAPQGSGDDTALNDIELYCKRPNSNEVTRKIWSAYTYSGSWSPDKYCSGTITCCWY